MADIVLVTGSRNPDTNSIVDKQQIDISVSMVDISVTVSSSIKPNFSATALDVVVGGSTLETGSVYYTPIYKEELDYDTWLTRINKNFQELD